MVSAFGAFFLSGNTMSLGTAFACMQVIFAIDEPLRWIPQFIGVLIDFLVSMRRIQKFLKCDEINPQLVHVGSEQLTDLNLDILVTNANFSWGGKKQKSEEDKKKEEEDKEKENKKADSKKVKQVVKKKVYTINEDFEQLDEHEDESLLDNSSSDDIEANTSTSSTKSTEGALSENIQLLDISLRIPKGEFV